jgi:hypothetical protein
LIELVENDRVIGGITPKCSARAEELYRIFCTGSLLKTSARTAEMCKLTENSFRDVGIAFANELSVICEKLGINVWELIRLANHHPRDSVARGSERDSNADFLRPLLDRVGHQPIDTNRRQHQRHQGNARLPKTGHSVDCTL